MKKTVRLLVLLAVFGAFCFGCSGSGNGGGGTLTVSVTNVDSLWSEPMEVAQVAPSDWYLVVAVVPGGSDPGADTTPLLAAGLAAIEAGAATVTAVNETDDIWRGSNGTTYDVYVILDLGGDLDPDPGTDYVVSSSGALEPQTFTMNGDETMSFDDTDFEIVGGT